MRCAVIATVIALFFGGAGPAQAQALSPMSSEFVSFSDRFLVHLAAFNPYDQKMLQTIRLYDANWRPVEGAYVSRQQFLLGPKQKANFMVMVPFGHHEERTVYVCNLSPLFTGAGQAVRGEVCGKYTALRRSY